MSTGTVIQVYHTHEIICTCISSLYTSMSIYDVVMYTEENIYS